MWNFTTLLKTILFGVLLFISTSISAQTVTVGKGSYSTSRSSNQAGPSRSDGQPAVPKISANFNQAIQTNDFWSSLIFSRSDNGHSNNIFAHPLKFKATTVGLELGHATTPVISSTQYSYDFASHLLVGVDGLSTSQTLTDRYDDWTVTALWESETKSMKSTFGHGLPYAYFTITGGDAVIKTLQSAQLWHNVNEVLGLTVNGVHYGVFAPTGSTWSGSTTFTSSLNGQNYFSIAVLPDSSTATLELFRKHAYAFVTNTQVDWFYDEANAKLTTTFTYETELKDAANGNINETMTALYRHQWLHTNNTLTQYSYASPRGIMKLLQGNAFSTEMTFHGILPSLPDVGDYNRIGLLNHIQDVAKERLSGGSTYDNGKAMGRFAQLIPIADQLGAVAEKAYFLAELKNRLEEWLTAGGSQEYVYDATWDVLTGYPSGFGADREINDHHFHASYAIFAAATVAQYDKDWAKQENWGGMINLLIRDANNWKRNELELPFLRSFDAYAGHAWAAGHADFANGNNQESSSESINFATAIFLWGEITNQTEIRDLGVFLHTTEAIAIDQYWFDVDNQTFPETFNKNALGMVWSSGGLHNTWFGDRPEFIHGINFLPLNSGSLYLGRHPDYVLENYNAMVADIGSQPRVWKDIFWKYISMSNADLALSLYNADLNYEPFDGETRAHTQHWLFNFKKLGHVNTTVTADIATYAVFVDESNDTSYIAFNSAATERNVTFSDGFTMTVPANELRTHRTVNDTSEITPAPVPTVNPENVISIFSDTYNSISGTNFIVDEGQNTVTTIERLQGNNTLKYTNLDVQTTVLGSPQNVASRSRLHLDYWTNDATSLQIFLISANNAEEKAELTIQTNSWQSVDIPLSTFAEKVDLTTISKIKIVGNGSLYIDNIFFSGNDAIPDGPTQAAANPSTNPSKVISIFSDFYTNISGVNLNPYWNQQTITTVESIQENAILKYSGLNYQGTDLGRNLDVSEMQWFQFDYWTDNATNLQMHLISPGPNGKPYDVSVVKNAWQRITIPLSFFADVVDLQAVFQLMVSGNGTLYLDNLYFWTDQTAEPEPQIAASNPETDASDVISIFSDYYESLSGVNVNPFWNQKTLTTIEQIAGNNVLKYKGLDFQGTDIGRNLDLSAMQWFQFDYWTADATNLQMYLVSPGPIEKAYDISVGQNEWQRVKIPLSFYADGVNLQEVFQLKVVGNGTVFLDNLYFGKNGTTTNIETLGNQIPKELALSQNYPNPFNPSTIIKFSIPEISNVSLTVFNSMGQQVARLINSRLVPGEYTATWNAATAPSGLYFYQLRFGDRILSKQMLLIK